MNLENIQVIIIDDHEVVREGIKGLLRSNENIEIVKEIGSVDNAYQIISTLKPHVILLDIRIGRADGLALARRIKIDYQESIKVIILSSYDDESYINRALRSHVDGYLLKTASSDYLAEAIVRVMHGDMVISPEIGGTLFKMNQSENLPTKPILDTQDIKILELLAEGKNIEEISRSLNYSERTAKRRISAIVTILDAKNRTEAVSKAIRAGIL